MSLGQVRVVVAGTIVDQGRIQVFELKGGVKIGEGTWDCLGPSETWDLRLLVSTSSSI